MSKVSHSQSAEANTKVESIIIEIEKVTTFLQHEYLNCACFAMSILLIILIVFLIVRIKYSPKRRTDFTINKLTLAPYYSCIVYLFLMSSQSIFINYNHDPIGWENLLFRQIQLLCSFTGAFAISIQLFEWYILTLMVTF